MKLITTLLSVISLFFVFFYEPQSNGFIKQPFFEKAQPPPNKTSNPSKSKNPHFLILQAIDIYAPKLSKEDVLKDPNKRISEIFAINPNFKDRVSFWFDIYTKYNSSQHVIHHKLYPWLVFSVVDGNPFFKKYKARWYAEKMVKKHVRAQHKTIQQALHRFLKNPYKKPKTELEKTLVKIFKQIPGSRKSAISSCLKNLRTQTGQRNYFLNGLNVGSAYFPHMETVFQEMNLPVELTRIPLVESSFNLKAHSRVGASGVWQIMPRTGRGSLIMNRYFDERSSPIKATRVAGDLLKLNKKILKHWPVAVTAYNAGVGNVKKAKTQVGSHHLPKIIKKNRVRAFSFASSNFYACFLAALYAEKYKQEVFGEIEVLPPLEIKLFTLTKPLNVNQIITSLEIDKTQFLNLNPDIKPLAIKNNRRLPKNFQIVIPIEKSQLTPVSMKTQEERAF